LRPPESVGIQRISEENAIDNEGRSGNIGKYYLNNLQWFAASASADGLERGGLK
jgi:hypothetical protein